MQGYNCITRPNNAHRQQRKEHNCAKEDLINWACWWCRETHIPLHVADVACGKGQDVNKWSQQRELLSLVASDVAHNALKEAHRRACEQGCAHWQHTHASGAAHLPTNTLGIVSMQFALHYFCNTQTNAAQLLDNIARALVPGGIFIGTTVNECALPAQVLRNTWGAEYKFELPQRIDCGVEWRVPRVAFQQLARLRGLRLCFWRTLHNWLVGANRPSTHQSNHCYVVFAFIRHN